MSRRTIIEINHDYLYRLEDPIVWARFVQELKSTRCMEAINAGERPVLCDGVRMLAQRHHADEITLKIK